MIIKAKHNIFLYPFFRFFVIWKMKRSFHSIRLKGEFNDRGLPVLLVCNHMSWWDGIWALYFSQKRLHRKFHFMMMEEQLRKNWFFKYTGGFSVAKKSRSVIETISHAAELLNDAANVVLMFPQGEIQSMHHQQFVFEKGLEKILLKTTRPVQVVMLADVIDYFSDVKPNLTIFFREYSGRHTVSEMEREYNRFYLECIQVQLETKE